MTGVQNQIILRTGQDGMGEENLKLMEQWCLGVAEVQRWSGVLL